MMKFPSREQVEMLRLEYPSGTRIELFSMEDPHASVLPGTKGTVKAVDDAGQILMNWDNGRSLSLIPGEDSFRRIPSEQNRQKAQKRQSHER